MINIFCITQQFSFDMHARAKSYAYEMLKSAP